MRPDEVGPAQLPLLSRSQDSHVSLSRVPDSESGFGVGVVRYVHKYVVPQISGMKIHL